jgi:Xaa-Pro dipeptidase
VVFKELKESDLMSVPIVLFNFKNYWLHPFVNKFIDGNTYEGILIFEKGKKPIWLSHPFNYNQAKKELSKIIIVKELKKDSLKQLFSKRKKIGYDSKYITLAHLKTLKTSLKGKVLVDMNKEIAINREIKSQKEIKLISKASIETKKVINKAIKKLRKGITEKEVEKYFKSEFEKDGFKTAFCIVAFGKNTTNLHHNSGNKKLIEGPVLFDVGAKYKGYCADISESMWFGKKSGKKYTDYSRELNFVKNKLEIVKNQLKPGIKANFIFKLCNGLAMPHALGHGLGLEEHDYPSAIGENTTWKLKSGMVLAIEPGTYNKEFGIRIERDYLIRKNGFKEL